MFDVKGERPQWQMVYERLSSMQIGEVIKYEELASLLPDAGEGSWRSAFARAVKEMEDQQHRTFANVRLTGYKMIDARDHEALARQHHRRANRQMKTAKRKIVSADRSRLSREERARFDAIELNLARQMEMTRRIEAKVKEETRERKAADASLSERVDRLTALLEKHGIGVKADASS